MHLFKRCAHFLEIFSEITGISFPYMVCRVTVHKIYNFTDFRFYHIINMIFICFHIFDDYMMLLTYLIRELFDIV